MPWRRSKFGIMFVASRLHPNADLPVGAVLGGTLTLMPYRPISKLVDPVEVPDKPN